MKRFLFLLLFIGINKLFAQSGDNKIAVGQIDSLHSNLLNEERKLWISVPDHSPGDGKRFPVLYMTDAELFFVTNRAMVQVLKDQMPDCIVIGIENTDRNRDLLPTHVDADLYMGQDSVALKTSGGAEKFEQFIEKEVIPYVESKYPTAPYRILSGHSYGGMFTVYTFVHHNSTFNAWIVSDPSLWWDHQLILRQAQEFLKTHQLKNETLFLGFANSVQSALGLDTTWVKRDTGRYTYHMRSILRFRDALQQNAKNGLRWGYKYYPAEFHGSVAPLVEFDALKFMFDYYLMREGDEMLKPGADAAGLLQKHYQVISQNLGYTVLPDANNIDGMAYDALKKKDYAKARSLFELYIHCYPGDWNAYDSMGDYFVAVDDKKKAAENFQKALKIKENPDTRKKLKELQQ